MIIGVPTEIKPDEYRVALIPAGVETLTRDGHTVLLQAGAGLDSGVTDDEFMAAGGQLLADPAEIWKRAELIVKVKEPLPSEWPKLRADQIVLTFFHFAASGALTQACLDAGITAVAYETIRDAGGRLPCLTPMSEVAGKMSIQEGAKYLEKPQQGRGVLLGGVPGVAPANVVVLGAGTVGACSARMAAGLGANVILMDINLDRLRMLDDVLPANVSTLFSDVHTVPAVLREADLVIGAVLIPGARAPHLVTRAMLKTMKPGSVIVDVAIDQGGCVESARPTTHQDPVYVVDGVVHYCVTNMPGAVARTSTFALCNATLPFARAIANHGWAQAAADDPGLAAGLNLLAGKITNAGVAAALEAK